VGIGLLVYFEIAVLVSFQTERAAVISGKEAEDIRVGTAKGLEAFTKEAAKL
jgi:hypothetical protein